MNIALALVEHPEIITQAQIPVVMITFIICVTIVAVAFFWNMK